MASFVVFPCKRKPVWLEIGATGASSPIFHTKAAMVFFPAFKYGARSIVSKYQLNKLPLAGPEHTAAPFTNKRYRLSALTCTIKETGTWFSSKFLRKW